MLAGDQPPLAIARVAVRIVGGLAIGADGARFLLPFQDTVVRYVAPEHVAAIAEIHRSFRPTATSEQAVDRGKRQAIAVEACIDHRHRRIGIALARFPHGPVSPVFATMMLARSRYRKPARCRCGASRKLSSSISMR